MAAIGWLLWGEVAQPDNDSGDLTGSRRGRDRAYSQDLRTQPDQQRRNEAFSFSTNDQNNEISFQCVSPNSFNPVVMLEVASKQ